MAYSSVGKAIAGLSSEYFTVQRDIDEMVIRHNLFSRARVDIGLTAIEGLGALSERHRTISTRLQHLLRFQHMMGLSDHDIMLESANRRRDSHGVPLLFKDLVYMQALVALHPFYNAIEERRGITPEEYEQARLFTTVDYYILLADPSIGLEHIADYLHFGYPESGPERLGALIARYEQIGDWGGVAQLSTVKGDLQDRIQALTASKRFADAAMLASRSHENRLLLNILIEGRAYYMGMEEGADRSDGAALEIAAFSSIHPGLLQESMWHMRLQDAVEILRIRTGLEQKVLDAAIKDGNVVQAAISYIKMGWARGGERPDTLTLMFDGAVVGPHHPKDLVRPPYSGIS